MTMEEAPGERKQVWGEERSQKSSQTKDNNEIKKWAGGIS